MPLIHNLITQQESLFPYRQRMACACPLSQDNKEPCRVTHQPLTVVTNKTHWTPYRPNNPVKCLHLTRIPHNVSPPTSFQLNLSESSFCFSFFFPCHHWDLRVSLIFNFQVTVKEKEKEDNRLFFHLQPPCSLILPFFHEA